MADRDDIWHTMISTPTASGTMEAAELQVVDLYHELGPQPENSTVEATIDIDQISRHSKVVVKSHVVANAARALNSPQYLATVRRREAGKIAQLVASLEKHADSDDFVAWTHEPLEKLRRLIQKLTEAEQFSDPEHEGNSCEILRQLRDTFLNSGWQRYGEPAVRALAVSVLQRLAVADEVSADDACKTMDRLLDLNLNPTVALMWQDGQEKEEVSH